MTKDPSKDFVEMHAIVSGYVQGVGFRATVHHYAIQLGLKGTVSNLPNGTVEIFAQGLKPNLEQLIEKLKQARPARIDHVFLEFQKPIDHFHSFSIV